MTAQHLAQIAEQLVLLAAAVSTSETDTALAAVETARAVLYLAQTVLQSLERNRH